MFLPGFPGCAVWYCALACVERADYRRTIAWASSNHSTATVDLEEFKIALYEAQVSRICWVKGVSLGVDPGALRRESGCGTQWRLRLFCADLHYMILRHVSVLVVLIVCVVLEEAD
jgi:hypothetical protein